MERRVDCVCCRTSVLERNYNRHINSKTHQDKVQWGQSRPGVGSNCFGTNNAFGSSSSASYSEPVFHTSLFPSMSSHETRNDSRIGEEVQYKLYNTVSSQSLRTTTTALNDELEVLRAKHNVELINVKGENNILQSKIQLQKQEEMKLKQQLQAALSQNQSNQFEMERESDKLKREVNQLRCQVSERDRAHSSYVEELKKDIQQLRTTNEKLELQLVTEKTSLLAVTQNYEKHIDALTMKYNKETDSLTLTHLQSLKKLQEHGEIVKTLNQRIEDKIRENHSLKVNLEEVNFENETLNGDLEVFHDRNTVMSEALIASNQENKRLNEYITIISSSIENFFMEMDHIKYSSGDESTLMMATVERELGADMTDDDNDYNDDDEGDDGDEVNDDEADMRTVDSEDLTVLEILREKYDRRLKALSIRIKAEMMRHENEIRKMRDGAGIFPEPTWKMIGYYLSCLAATILQLPRANSSDDSIFSFLCGSALGVGCYISSRCVKTITSEHCKYFISPLEFVIQYFGYISPWLLLSDLMPESTALKILYSSSSCFGVARAAQYLFSFVKREKNFN